MCVKESLLNFKEFLNKKCAKGIEPRTIESLYFDNHQLDAYESLEGLVQEKNKNKILSNNEDQNLLEIKNSSVKEDSKQEKS